MKAPDYYRSGIHGATMQEVEKLLDLVERIHPQRLDSVIRWITERSDSGNAASAAYVISILEKQIEEGG
jgi:hypothetical protein